MKRKVRALGLMSGGLDSMLSVCVLKEQGIEVTGITFTSPFFGSKNAEKAAEQLEIGLKIIDFTNEHLKLVKNPPRGYGKCMNPCIDCHALMIRWAGEVLREEDYDFLATGEVLGERPMSQNRQSLDIVVRDSGAGDILLRPLSAKLLPPTRPELSGLVDRERLLAIEGRSRKPQMALAQKYGIKSYVQPAGGCLLTDPAFSVRLKDLFNTNSEATAWDVKLLKLGRHFRLPSGVKVVVGRDETDNERILKVAKERGVLLAPSVVPGPNVFVVAKECSSDIDLAARLCASYSDHEGREVEICVTSPDSSQRIYANPMPREKFATMKI